MDRSPTNVSASVLQQLFDTSQAHNTDYNALVIQYGIERFLYRLSKSDLADGFVLKGAMLFRVWAAGLHRPTKDLDLLGYGEPDPEGVAAAVRRIVATPVDDDGLQFESSTVAAGLIREEQEYGDIRVKLVAMLGTVRIHLQVDVGFGDAVVPPPKIAPFPTLLEHATPWVLMYPVETMVAEKLETIVTLGVANSRMKDYYDLMVIFRRCTLDRKILAKAIAATFGRRQTPAPVDRPIGLSADFTRNPDVQQRWQAFLGRLQINDAPADLRDVADGIWAHVLSGGAQSHVEALEKRPSD
jgi:hypothetical protein